MSTVGFIVLVVGLALIAAAIAGFIIYVGVPILDALNHIADLIAELHERDE